MTEAPLGFAVAAPILSLAEGNRTITLLAHLATPSSPVVAQNIEYALDVTVTGAKGWLTADSVQAQPDRGRWFRASPRSRSMATIGAAAPAVVAFDPALHGPGPAVGRPMLRCLIKGDTGIYEVLDGLIVETRRPVGRRHRRSQSGRAERRGPAERQSADAAVRQSAADRRGILYRQRGSVRQAADLARPAAGMEIAAGESLRSLCAAISTATDDFLKNNFHTFFEADVDLLYDRSFRPLLVNQFLFASGRDRAPDDLGGRERVRLGVRGTPIPRAARSGATGCVRCRHQTRFRAAGAHQPDTRATSPGLPRRCRSKRLVTARSRDGTRTRRSPSASGRRGHRINRSCQTSRTRRCSSRCRSTTARRRRSSPAMSTTPQHS